MLVGIDMSLTSGGGMGKPEADMIKKIGREVVESVPPRYNMSNVCVY